MSMGLTIIVGFIVIMIMQFMIELIIVHVKYCNEVKKIHLINKYLSVNTMKVEEALRAYGGVINKELVEVTDKGEMKANEKR